MTITLQWGDGFNLDKLGPLHQAASYNGAPFYTPEVTMTTIITMIDTLTEALGRLLAWLSLAICLLTFMVVVIQDGFQLNALPWIGLSARALQETVIYCHSALFLLAAGYALKQDSHVRVDIFYRKFSARGRAWTNLLGNLVLLFPFSLFVLLTSLDYVAFSWKMGERSAEAEGLANVFLLKALIPSMAILLMFQGTSECLKSLQTITGVANND